MMGIEAHLHKKLTKLMLKSFYKVTKGKRNRTYWCLTSQNDMKNHKYKNFRWIKVGRGNQEMVFSSSSIQKERTPSSSAT